MSVIFNVRQCQSLLRFSNCMEIAGFRVKRFQHDPSPAEKDAARNEANFKYEDAPFLSRVLWPDEGKMPFFVELKKRMVRKNGWTDYFISKQRMNEEKEHSLAKAELENLGIDLVLAHFVISRKGGVKFSKMDEWLYLRDKASVELPTLYDPDYHVTGVDISGLPLGANALEFFENTTLTHLSIARCPFADDWWLDFISGAIPSLKHLDISGCQRITYRGLGVLYRCQKLESLMLQGFTYNPFLEMTLLELEQVLPGLKIYGIDNWENDKKNGKSQPKESEARN